MSVAGFKPLFPLREVRKAPRNNEEKTKADKKTSEPVEMCGSMHMVGINLRGKIDGNCGKFRN